MTIKGLALAVSGAVALWSCQGGPVKQDVGSVTELYPEAQAQVETALRAVLRAAETKDMAALESYHLYGPKFTKFDDWEPLNRQDAVTARKAENGGLSALTSFKPSVEDLKVDVFGNVAIATFILNYTLEAGGTNVATRARSTMVFVRDGSQWKIVHEHHSAFKANP